MKGINLLKPDTENLPKGWVRTTLAYILNQRKDKFDPKSGQNYPFVGLEHIGSHSRTVIGHGDSTNTKSTKSVFQCGDILYGKLRPYLNKVSIPNFKGVCSTDIWVFQQNKNMDNKYVMLFLSTNEFVHFARNNMSGTQHPRIKWEKFSKYLIPLPPLNEQKRIVSKLESIFAQIDAAKERLLELQGRMQSGQTSLKSLKSSVLKQAFEGRLVPQDPKDEPAEVLLEKNCKDSEINYEKDNLPEGWIEIKLESICTKITDGSHNSPPNSPIGEIPYVTAKNIRPKKLDFTNITYVTKESHREIFARCNPEKDDVLYTKDGTVGYAVVNDHDCEFSLLSSVALLKPCRAIVNSYYLENFLNSPTTYESVIKNTSGTALRRIILKRIKEIKILLPPLNEQQRIVSKIESIFARIDTRCRSIVFTSLSNLLSHMIH